MKRTIKNNSWAGAIPTDWDTVPLKSRFSFGKGLPITKEDLLDEGLPVISYGQIHSKECTGVHVDKDLVRYVSKQFEISNPQSATHEGDIIVADTSEDLDGCGNAILIDSIDAIFAGYHTIILKKTSADDSKYYAYLFRTDAWRSQIRKQLTDVKVYSVSQKVLKAIELLTPPISEQAAIVSFLDSRCAKIDEAIERHKKIIEKLEEYRKSVINHSVLHGLNDDVSERGSEVIGSYPAHWRISRLKYVANVVRGGSPRPIDDYITDSDGYNWIKIGDATGNGKYINSTKQQIKKEGLSKTRLVHPGTLLLTNSMSFGHPYILNIDGCIHDGWLAFSDYSDIEQDYLYYFLMSDSAMNQFVRSVEGSVVNNLNIEKVRNSLITIPPRKEQAEIIAFLDEQNLVIDNAISRQQMSVEKLEEYRKSLIYNAVTGKIDCRELM